MVAHCQPSPAAVPHEDGGAESPPFHDQATMITAIALLIASSTTTSVFAAPAERRPAVPSTAIHRGSVASASGAYLEEMRQLERLAAVFAVTPTAGTTLITVAGVTPEM